jgi:hypothetical protein
MPIQAVRVAVAFLELANRRVPSAVRLQVRCFPPHLTLTGVARGLKRDTGPSNCEWWR